MNADRRAIIVLALVVHAFPAGAAVVCRQGIAADTAERAFAILNRPLAEPACHFEGVETSRSALEARWTRDGAALPPLRVVPRECAPEAPEHAGRFVVQIPSEIGERCPSAASYIAELRSEIAGERPADEAGSTADPLYRASRALFAAVLFLSGYLLLRAVPKLRSFDRWWLVLGTAGFCGGLLLRAMLPFSLGNWYSEVLPASGPPPPMRFGPGLFAFQSLLRDAAIWNARTLTVSQLLIGALAAPLLLGTLRELRLGWSATAATVALLICSPIHARLSATSSEHVLAATLCLALLYCWVRATRDVRPAWFGLAVLLFPCVCFTRVDMAVQAALVSLWPLLPDRIERAGRASLRTVGWRAAILGLVIAATLAITYRFIALPSHHPFPEPGARLFAARSAIRQFWSAAIDTPTWVTLPSVGLATIGILPMLVRRPLLLARIILTLFLSFTVLGRTLIEGLIGARYFLFTIPVFLVLSGYGFETLVNVVPRRLRGTASAVGLLALMLWSMLDALPAYRVRYTFQDEYSFLRTALTQLPAGCIVYEVPLRGEGLARDVDCCLDAPRSPLVLAFPELQFRSLPETGPSFDEADCVAYYESSACRIIDDPNDPTVHDRAATAVPFFQSRCDAVYGSDRLDLLASTSTSPRATVDLFRGTTPRVALYRWTRDRP